MMLQWLGVAIFMIRIVVRNYEKYGSFFGSNEIMAMSRHDLIVLGLSDGIMFLSTGVGWILRESKSHEFPNIDRF